MIQTINRNEQEDGSFIVERIKDGVVQFLREKSETTGEIESPESEMITTETITITRHIGEKITF